MFEAVELGQVLSKTEYREREPEIRKRLLALQQALKDANVPVLIIVAGVEGAGKGEVVNRLNKWFDTRNVITYAFWDETDEELQRPLEWRFWRRLPGRGEMALMFGGWYWGPLYQKTFDQMTVAELDDAMRRISELERMLYLDGTLIIKIWFHLSYKTHTLRQKRREATQEHLRAVTREGTGGKYYESFLAAAERTIRLTDSGENPWHLVDAEDKRFRDYSTAQVLIQEMEQRLDEHRVSERRASVHDTVVTTETNPVTVLDRLDINAQLDDATYKTNLKQLQARLNELAWRAYDQKRSTILVFEGWDAAGKGGVIRRITTAIDARLYRVISVAAPSDEELAHHYLWRFWRKVPRDGYITIYDRSWYGRVLVERVEGLAKPYEWMRAYQEINDFEERLTDHGTILQKFWLHISPEEQLRRFSEREQTPWKQHKITEDDWRNRERWDDYKQAVNNMVEHTSTANAPWSLIPANDKKYVRVEALKSVCNGLEQALEKKRERN